MPWGCEVRKDKARHVRRRSHESYRQSERRPDMPSNTCRECPRCFSLSSIHVMLWPRLENACRYALTAHSTWMGRGCCCGLLLTDVLLAQCGTEATRRMGLADTCRKHPTVWPTNPGPGNIPGRPGEPCPGFLFESQAVILQALPFDVLRASASAGTPFEQRWHWEETKG